MPIATRFGPSRARTLTLAVFAIAMLVAAAGITANAVAKPKPEHYSCTQAPAGGKGPINKAMVRDTGECFDELHLATKGQTAILKSINAGCSTMDQKTRQRTADGLTAQGKAALNEIDDTRKAKRDYFKAESNWYERKDRTAVANKLDDVKKAVGKASLDASGYWTNVQGFAEALRNNDCGEVQTQLGEASKGVDKLGRSVADLKKTLAALP